MRFLILFVLASSWCDVDVALSGGLIPVQAQLAGALTPDTAATGPSARESLLVGTAPLLEVGSSAPAETATVATPPRPVPVFLGGREIFRVRVGRDGLDPLRRAAAIRGRLDLAISDRSVAADQTRLISTLQGTELRLGPHFLWVITPGDVPNADSAEFSARLAELPRRIAAGVERERAAGTPARLAASAAIALGLTLLAWVLLRLLAVARRLWQSWLSHRLTGHFRPLRIRNFDVLSRAQLGGLTLAVLGRWDVLVALGLLYAYLTAVLSLFPWTQSWSSVLFGFASRQVLVALESLWRALPDLLVLVVLFFVFRSLARLADRLFDAIEKGDVRLRGFHPELARPSRQLARIFLWVAAVMVAYPFIPGSDSRAVQGVSILLGVMASLGSTGLVANIIAGIVLTYARSFRIGERVRIGDHVGDVMSLGFFATKLRTIRNEEVTLPNGQVANAAIVNYTRHSGDPGLILHTEVTVGYDVEWRRVQALLIEAALRVDGVEREPAPWVYQRSLNDNHVSYELDCVTHLSHPQLKIYSDLHAEIQDAFNRAGIEMLSPVYHAIRDANEPVFPPEPSGPRPQPGGFRVQPPAAPRA